MSQLLEQPRSTARQQAAHETPLLTMYMGVPGSGKSTHAKANARGHLLSADAIRNRGADAETHMEWIRRRALALLGEGSDVTVDACNVHAAPRRALLNVAALAGARTRLVVIDTAPALARAAQRRRRHPVPQRSLDRYLAAWPAAVRQAESEPWDEIVVVTRGRAKS